MQTRRGSGSCRSVWNLGAVAARVVFVVDDEQDHAQEEADGAHGDVGDAQEGVLAAHPGNGAQDHSLTAVEAEHGVIWLHGIRGKQLFSS